MNTPEEIEYRRDLARIQAAGEYNLRHLAQHLHAAGQQDKLFRLLVKNQAWLEAKFARLGGHDAYTGDLELATGSFGDPLTPSHLLTLVQLHAARRAVNQQTGLYNDTDLATLTWLGHESEALSHARLRDDPRQKAGGLLLIYNSLRERGGHAPGLLDEAEEAIAAIRVPVARLSALCDLALARGLASDGRAEAHFSEIRRVAGGLSHNSSDWIDLFAKLLRALVDLQRYDEAVALARTLVQEPQELLGQGGYMAGALAIALVRAGRYDEADLAQQLVKPERVQAHVLDNLDKALAEREDETAAALRERVRTRAAQIREQAAAPDMATDRLQVVRRLAQDLGVDEAVLQEHLDTVHEVEWSDRTREEALAKEYEAWRTSALLELANALSGGEAGQGMPCLRR